MEGYFQLKEINRLAGTDPKGFVEAENDNFQKKLENAASMIIENMRHSPIVLLSGPSGSGKTTTSMKLAAELERRGVGSHSISLDDYFRTVDPLTTPRTAKGDYDLESPKCLDMDLLNHHFTELSAGRSIVVPKYEFARQISYFDPSRTLRLGSDEIAIFEGIHALNDDITSVHPEAFKLYVSARSGVADGSELVFKATWMRLLRRTVRDNLFRGSSAAMTLKMWANVRRGEKANISPFKNRADYQFDSAFQYEVCVLKKHALKLFEHLDADTERYAELMGFIPAIERFADIDDALLPPDALLREFIGGGIYG